MTAHLGPHDGCVLPFHASDCPDWHPDDEPCPRCAAGRVS